MNKFSMYKRRVFVKNIGAICGEFRKNNLRLTLRNMEQKTNIPVSTLNSFELGRSSSLNMLYIYLVSCETQEQTEEFLKYIVQVCLFNWRL